MDNDHCANDAVFNLSFIHFSLPGNNMTFLLEHIDNFITAAVSIVAIIWSHKTAKFASKSQLTQTALQEIITQRMDAFSNLLKAYTEYNIGNNALDEKYIANLTIAFPRAILLASPKTADKISLLQETTYTHFSDEDIDAILQDVIECMQEDLRIFSAPIIE